MNIQRRQVRAVIFPLLFLELFLSIGDSVLAEPTSKHEGTTTKDGQLKTSDLPKPLQEIGEVIERVGNEVSKGVSKVSKAVREAPEKVEKNKTKEK